MSVASTACRACGADRLRTFLDLGSTPLADALVDPARPAAEERRHPLVVAFCERCAVVQLRDQLPAEQLFPADYPYHSSYSDLTLAHARAHIDGLVAEGRLGPGSLLVEVASNDGYLLRQAAEAGIAVLGIDPAPGPVAVARAAGVPTVCGFFGRELAERLVAGTVGSYGPVQADVIVANNVAAHVPDLNGFLGAMRTLLRPDGLITIENPSVHELLRRNAFDTIYHEHLWYHGCVGMDGLTVHNGLHLNDVEYFPDLHGGTLRYRVSRRPGRSAALTARLDEERAAGLHTFDAYAAFADRVDRARTALRDRLVALRAEGCSIAAYGAAAKGATLLNVADIGTDLVPYVVDRNTHKHGLRMPGTHQPILPTAELLRRRPDVVLLLAWNMRDEVLAQQADYTAAGGRWLVPVPEVAEVTP